MRGTAEVAYGGLPGWTARYNCTLRSNCTEYTDAVDSYLSTVGKIIADAQITHGGPVVLVQPENECAHPTPCLILILRTEPLPSLQIRDLAK